MKTQEYAIEISKDRNLSEAEILNMSGLLETASMEDIPGLLFSVGVLRNAESRFLEEVKKGIRQI